MLSRPALTLSKFAKSPLGHESMPHFRLYGVRDPRTAPETFTNRRS